LFNVLTRNQLTFFIISKLHSVDCLTNHWCLERTIVYQSILWEFQLSKTQFSIGQCIFLQKKLSIYLWCHLRTALFY